MKTTPTPEEYLVNTEPFFKAELEEKRMRGKVCEVMGNYANLCVSKKAEVASTQKSTEEVMPTNKEKTGKVRLSVKVRLSNCGLGK